MVSSRRRRRPPNHEGGLTCGKRRKAAQTHRFLSHPEKKICRPLKALVGIRTVRRQKLSYTSRLRGYCTRPDGGRSGDVRTQDVRALAGVAASLGDWDTCPSSP